MVHLLEMGRTCLRGRFLYPFFCGLLIGACDLIPGISGGTMALILGIYQPFMQSIHEVKKGSFKTLQFLGLILLGIVCSLVILSSFFHTLLQNSEQRLYLYSLFFGLVGGSTWIIGREIPKWTRANGLLLIVGALVAYGVTKMPILLSEPQGASFYLWLFMAGSLAVCAMLLPGISGSYVLMVLGPYPLVLESLSKLKSLDFSALEVLLPLGCGILTGAALFSKWISFFLKEHKGPTLTLLLGFMVGASTAVWPFANFPPFESTTFIGFATMGAGACCVLGIESLATRTSP